MYIGEVTNFTQGSKQTLTIKPKRMLYEQQLRMLAQAVFNAYYGLIHGENMSIPKEGFKKSFIFMPKIFARTSKGQTVKQIRDNIENFLDERERFKVYFVKGMKLTQNEMNFIVYMEYMSWLRKQNKK